MRRGEMAECINLVLFQEILDSCSFKHRTVTLCSNHTVGIEVEIFSKCKVLNFYQILTIGTQINSRCNKKKTDQKTLKNVD